jgi:hypothetical protein
LWCFENRVSKLDTVVSALQRYLDVGDVMETPTPQVKLPKPRKVPVTDHAVVPDEFPEIPAPAFKYTPEECPASNGHHSLHECRLCGVRL